MSGILLLRDLVILLALSIPVVAIAQRLRIPTVVGFLLAGLMVGPHGFRLISQPWIVQELAELGVVLLLFTIGLELSLSRILKLGRHLFLSGALQVGLTTLAVAVTAFVLTDAPVRRAVFFGSLVALSSTAIVLKAYADRGELDTPPARIAVSILLFQDLYVVPLMLFVPVLANIGAGRVIAWGSVIGSLFVVVGLVTLGRFLIPRVLDRVVLLRNREVFTLCMGFIGLGAAFITATFGLSLALGAFLAGLIISESKYGLQALSDALPFRDMFSGIFFISVGMLLDLRLLLESFTWVVLATLAVMVIKAAIATVVIWAMGRPFQTSLVSGLGLAQVGEFSFVLASVGRPLGLFAGGEYQLFLAASVTSMLAAPFLIAGARPFAEAVARVLNLQGLVRLPHEETDVTKLRDHAILVGYGLSGRHLVRVLKAAEMPYVVVEQNGQLVRRARDEKVNIVFGDGARREVLHRIGIERARVVVFAIASLVDERRGVAMARHLNPTVRIVVRTRYVMAIDDLMQLGASEVVVEEFEATLELFARILEFYEIPGNTIQRELDFVRSEHYGMMRGKSLPQLKLDALRHMGIHGALELVEVEEGARALEQSVVSLRLRQETGAAVIAVVREGKALYPPDPSLQFRQGDTVVLVGEPDALARGVAVFCAPGERQPNSPV